jgi:hypothetical protein
VVGLDRLTGLSGVGNRRTRVRIGLVLAGRVAVPVAVSQAEGPVPSTDFPASSNSSRGTALCTDPITRRRVVGDRSIDHIAVPIGGVYGVSRPGRGERAPTFRPRRVPYRRPSLTTRCAGAPVEQHSTSAAVRPRRSKRRPPRRPGSRNTPDGGFVKGLAPRHLRRDVMHDPVDIGGPGRIANRTERPGRLVVVGGQFVDPIGDARPLRSVEELLRRDAQPVRADVRPSPDAGTAED